MSLFVEGFNVFRADSQLDVARELAFESFLVFTLELLHVFSNVLPEDVLAVNGSVESFLFSVVSGEAFDGMRDVESTIDGALHGTENTGTGSCAG